MAVVALGQADVGESVEFELVEGQKNCWAEAPRQLEVYEPSKVVYACRLWEALGSPPINLSRSGCIHVGIIGVRLCRFQPRNIGQIVSYQKGLGPVFE
jgi:hypothetical protein